MAACVLLWGAAIDSYADAIVAVVAGCMQVIWFPLVLVLLSCVPRPCSLRIRFGTCLPVTGGLRADGAYGHCRFFVLFFTVLFVLFVLFLLCFTLLCCIAVVQVKIRLRYFSSCSFRVLVDVASVV